MSRVLKLQYCPLQQYCFLVQVGKLNIFNRPPLFEAFVEHEIQVWSRILKGKEQSERADVTAERSMLSQLNQLLEEST